VIAALILVEANHGIGISRTWTCRDSYREPGIPVQSPIHVCFGRNRCCCYHSFRGTSWQMSASFCKGTALLTLSGSMLLTLAYLSQDAALVSVANFDGKENQRCVLIVFKVMTRKVDEGALLLHLIALTVHKRRSLLRFRPKEFTGKDVTITVTTITRSLI